MSDLVIFSVVFGGFFVLGGIAATAIPSREEVVARMREHPDVALR